MSPALDADQSTTRARALLDALIDAGLRELVLCPGSRSAPVAYAALAASNAGRLRLHVRVDERSAGFLALGLATRTGLPAAVVTTSGTAVANLHPAVLEAYHAAVPLVVISADRPREVRETGANQTTRQPGIFGTALRFEVDLPDDPQVAPEAWSSAAQEAYAAAVTLGAAGPVHLNAPFREPLVPAQPTLTDATSQATTPAAEVGWFRGLPEIPWTLDQGRITPALPERTVVVLGDLPHHGLDVEIADWAARHGWPVIAEPFGHHPRWQVPHGVLLLGVTDFVHAHAPECVVVAGRPTLSRPVTRLLSRDGIRLVRLAAGTTWASTAYPDAEQYWWRAVFHESLREWADPAEVPPSPWAEAWYAAGHAIEDTLAVDDMDPVARAVPTTDIPGWRLVRALVAALPREAVLFLGSSKGVRDVDAASAPRTQGLDLVANRGLAGIDGCVSTAIGIALAAPVDTPTYALLGDLTFLHDSNGLLIGPDEPWPDLTIVVVNDDGGGIFTLLEPGEPGRAREFERLFGTPTGTDLAALCAAHGVRHTLSPDLAGLLDVVREAPRGLHVVEVRTSRDRHRADQDHLRAVAAAAVTAAALAGG